MGHRLLAAAFLLTAACGGSPATPSPIAAATALPVSLPAGAYTLTITLSRSGLPACTPGAPCAAVSLCAGTPAATSARFDVRVDRAGDEARITVDGATGALATLHTASVPATGSIQVAAPDAAGVAVDVRGTMTGFGSLTPGIAASGNIDGDVTFGGGGCSNNGHVWTLSGR